MDSITRLVRMAGWVGLSGCCIAMAQPGPADRALAAARTDVAPQMASAELIHDGPSVTRWGSGSGSALGVSLGARGAIAAREALQLGVHWRGSLPGRWQWRLSGWADWPGAGPDASWPGARQGTDGMAYAAQVEVQWQSARYGGLIPEYGAIGVRLQGGSRLMLRARHGGPMVYYRMRF